MVKRVYKVFVRSDALVNNTFLVNFGEDFTKCIGGKVEIESARFEKTSNNFSTIEGLMISLNGVPTRSYDTGNLGFSNVLLYYPTDSAGAILAVDARDLPKHSINIPPQFDLQNKLFTMTVKDEDHATIANFAWRIMLRFELEFTD